MEAINGIPISQSQRNQLAQKFMEMYSAQQDKQQAQLLEGRRAAEKALEEAFIARRLQEDAAWLEECKKDPELGGQKFEENKAVIKRGCTRLATQEAVDALNLLGVGTHPEIVRMFYRAGKLLGEDPGAKGDTARAPTEDPLVTMYRKSLEG